MVAGGAGCDLLNKSLVQSKFPNRSERGAVRRDRAAFSTVQT
nr:MAG TPA: hypothetical protein [Caudoviricetes sp.]